MHKSQDFLVEIGTEELPAKELLPLVSSFAESLTQQLTAAGITFKADVKRFATPRRLAVLITDLAAQQPAQLVTKRGPAITAAYNADGTPTKAALGFASSCGVDMQDLTKQETDKGAWLYFEQTVAGKPTIDLLPEMIAKALAQLPVKKYMRWGNGDLAFVRPIHWIVMLYGADIVPAKLYGITASNQTFGHRVHAPQAIKITKPANYAQQLKEGFVIADFAEREEKIRDYIFNEAKQKTVNSELLILVTGLVEWPVPLLANFDPAFLRVPKECLISSMQEHQKCFPLLDKNDVLLPKFVLISNIASTDPATVIHGNELVMNARLADAAFYYDKDQKQSLDSRVEQLKTVTYQKQLGSLYDKTLRIQELSIDLATNINANIKSTGHTDETKVDIKATESAAKLCKADLLTNMVYEFPELQGVMGAYYARHDGETEAVATAIKQHYWPKFATDSIPTTNEGVCIALADRIDTLVGFFGIDIVPTGDKDPYALRRQAIAVLRIMIDKEINLDLANILITSRSKYKVGIKSPEKNMMEFFSERLKSLYIANDFTPQNIASVLETIDHETINRKTSYVPIQIHNKITAISEFQKLPEAESLAAANKRVKNLLEKNNITRDDTDHTINESLLNEAAEIELYKAIINKEKLIDPLLTDWKYSDVLISLSTLQQPVDNFFTNVMVMVDDPALRDNRLHLLYRLRNLFLKVADISLL